MWNVRNTTDEHRGRERQIRYKKREVNHKRLLNTDNKLRVVGGVVRGVGEGLNG